jgi:hypothetical protein
MSTVELSSPSAKVESLVAMLDDIEPTALQSELRGLVGEDPIAGKVRAVEAVAERLWQSWASELSLRGLDREHFGAIVLGADHEVWLWVMGDRPYVQLSAALAGRALRRSAAI